MTNKNKLKNFEKTIVKNWKKIYNSNCKIFTIL